MDVKHWTIYVLFISLELFAVSFFMEIYKKRIRKDNFKVWEVRLLGIVLSAGCFWLLLSSHLMYPVFNSMFGSDLWLDHLAYTVLFYILQEKVDMKIMKRIIRSLAIQFIRTSTGLDKDKVEEILAEMESKKA